MGAKPPPSNLDRVSRRVNCVFNLLDNKLLAHAFATNSLDRALLLLKTVEQTPGGLRHSEISRRLKIPKSTCSYILSRLQFQHALTRDPPDSPPGQQETALLSTG